MQLNLCTTATLGTKENFSTTFLLDNLDSLASNNSYQSLEFNNSTTGSAPDQSFSSAMGPLLHSSSPIACSPKQKRRKLKVISLNCNGMKSPTEKAEFQALIDLHKPDIVLGCESKLDSTIPTYSVFPSTYDIFRKDRTLRGGGVFIGVRNDIIATEQVRLDVHNCEIITVPIKFAKSKTLLLSSYYDPPAFDTNALDDVLSRTYSPNPPLVIFTGDFNCGGIDWSTRLILLKPAT